ncbi:MAG TPA: AAA family ATPase, partial [Burkholderiaceae bacterium]|nr:AAA family ATPase [Burkholderiaceae bacterium]
MSALTFSTIAGARRDDDLGFDAFAHAFGRVIAAHHLQADGEADDAPWIERAARALMFAEAQGHARLPLNELAAFAVSPNDGGGDEQWVARLSRSPVVGMAHGAWTERPLVLDAHAHLALARYHAYEHAIAARWRVRCGPAPLASADRLRAALDRWFASSRAHGGDNERDWQRIAAGVALTRGACVLCGGPGTGKTTTIARLLLAALSVVPDLSIALAAPTGKAAARMSDAVRMQLDALAPDADVRARLSIEARTVHALLGLDPQGGRPRHHAGRPLPARLVVIDEASMLGLALARRLFDAL